MSISHVLELSGKSLFAAAGMLWEMLWALILGFALSGVMIAFAPKAKLTRLLGKPGPKEIGLAMVFGAASSSCSYAAAAMSRTLFKKGAHIIPVLAFLLASTNLVVELSTVLWVMMGWQFVAAELFGGILLVIIMALLMRWIGPLEEFSARQRGTKENDSKIETLLASPKTLAGWRAVAIAFVMEWQMLWKDILLGILISGVLMAWVPDSFWRSLFLQGPSSPSGSFAFFQLLENALVGPIVSVLSFVCSIGNIPVANVLYQGGISFGGAISFIYADLIIIPLILIYRKDYGWRLALWITGIFYISMVVAGILVDLLFHSLGWIPSRHASRMADMPEMGGFGFDSTFWLNLSFLVLAAGLVWLARTGPRAESEAHDCCQGE